MQLGCGLRFGSSKLLIFFVFKHTKVAIRAQFLLFPILYLLSHPLPPTSAFTRTLCLSHREQFHLCKDPPRLRIPVASPLLSACFASRPPPSTVDWIIGQVIFFLPCVSPTVVSKNMKCQPGEKNLLCYFLYNVIIINQQCY